MSHFIYDNTGLPTPKFNLGPLPPGANPNQWLKAEEWVTSMQAMLDVKTWARGAIWFGVVPQVLDPAPGGVPDYLWLRNDNTWMHNATPLSGIGSVIIADEGSNIPNTPHTRFDFVGAGVTVTDAGGGTATVTVSGGGAATFIQEDVFTPLDLQTVFTLSQIWAGGYAIVYVNGIEYVRNINFTIAGTTLTWLDTPFTLAATMRVVADYLTLGTQVNLQEDVFTAINLQTVFTLSQPWGGVFAVAYVNGVEYVVGIDYTIVGTTLTWLDVPFTMQAGDQVVVDYGF